MGWARYLLLGNLGQQLDIVDQKSEIEQLRDALHRNRSTSSAAAEGIERLQDENDELRLYLAAVVRLLVSKGVVTRDEMRNVVDAIDEEDGRRDGRRKGRVE